jgi:lipid II:glycine glycyltransferase (peptidoglycan interpeptide bridge formation enzyme)
MAGGCTLLDAASPYGYPGPILSQMADDERQAFLREALPTLVDGLSDAGIVSVFVRMHPFVGLRSEEVAGFGSTIYHGDTVIIDLTQPEEALWSQTRKGHRYEINRSRKRKQRAFLDKNWEHLPQFIEIYAETMRRVEAKESYLYSRNYFLTLRKALGEHLHLWVVDIDGDAAAASLFTEYKGIVQYHLSGTRTDYLGAQPNKLLLHEVRSWAKERGNRVMHLGGGVGGGQDSLFAFKSGFSKVTCSFYSWRLITNPESYIDLTRRRGIKSGSESPTDFFPEYRRPIG